VIACCWPCSGRAGRRPVRGGGPRRRVHCPDLVQPGIDPRQSPSGGHGQDRPDGRNPYAGWIAAAAVSLLLVVLGTPVLRRLFAFAMPDAAALLLSCLVAVATLAWCALLGHVHASLRPGAR